MKIASFALAAALAIGASSPVLADTAVFRFADLDLTTPAGKATFDARMDAAVRRACPEQELTGTRVPANRGRAECMRQARKQIVDRLAAQGISAKVSG